MELPLLLCFAHVGAGNAPALLSRGALASWTHCGIQPNRLVMAARTTSALLVVKMPPPPLQEPPRATSVSIILAGGMLGAALLSEEYAEMAPKTAAKKQKTAPKPAKKPGPALSVLEAAMQPEKVYNVEKLLASRLNGRPLAGARPSGSRKHRLRRAQQRSAALISSTLNGCRGVGADTSVGHLR